MASKKKVEYPSDAYEYVDWLYNSGRLTAEEHITLKKYLLNLEAHVCENQGC